ncbi:ABC transporter ATP-binding protein [Prauserella sp. PE36]|uniref:ABC transporter ATP-binding protein n=1 Tax=Prauserella sp. PE36 TaxID=1504709 RepID=UPI000D8FADDC|nr:ABC transporter ATP-binding protein [Prauserella sp. PE36]PXY29056.1 ABC transporter ATP-binding protein [Prauserella coralliicola]RBM14727.1 ABC transporter ATP-binding protein [Prauserella sp. PE36]
MDVGIEGLTVTVASTRLVSDLRVAVPSGAVVGLIGPNGSGKSTTLRCVYRALRPSAGRVLVNGDDVWRLTARDSARRVAALPQEQHAEFDFTVAEVVAMGRSPHQGRLEADSDADREICAAALRRVGVRHLARRGFLTLSGGERQRVLIARALAQEPSVLVLDEPTNHLDIRHQLEILALVRDSGVTALVALHDLNLAAGACDVLYVLDAGGVVTSGSPRDVLTPELLATVFGVHAHVLEHPVSGAPQLVFSSAPDPEGTP